mmetsp:Transcript_89228/g.158190  ORF Transcript_89228/g.158190 Transcript_89228/m.158190 type:complete len:263 (+) Transcript_89228:123-911(+)
MCMTARASPTQTQEEADALAVQHLHLAGVSEELISRCKECLKRDRPAGQAVDSAEDAGRSTSSSLEQLLSNPSVRIAIEAQDDWRSDEDASVCEDDTTPETWTRIRIRAAKLCGLPEDASFPEHDDEESSSSSETKTPSKERYGFVRKVSSSSFLAAAQDTLVDALRLPRVPHQRYESLRDLVPRAGIQGRQGRQDASPRTKDGLSGRSLSELTSRCWRCNCSGLTCFSSGSGLGGCWPFKELRQMARQDQDQGNLSVRATS